MIELKDLLKRFEKIIGHNSLAVSAVQEVLRKSLGINLDKDKIRIKGKVVLLDVKPLYKNEILIRKKALLDDLRRLGQAFEDIH